MGKQRYWSGHGTKTTASASTKRVVKNEPNLDLDNEASSSSTSAGCMCAVFQLFDFHPLNNLPTHSPVSLNPPPDHHISKGSFFLNFPTKRLDFELWVCFRMIKF